MYIIKSEHSFDSAHFLANYDGKCNNIHGHRWRVIIEIKSNELRKDERLDGMVVDFTDLKNDLRQIVDELDHALIIQKNSLQKTTMKCLLDEQFKIIEVDFRPTAENFANYFFVKMKEKGYQVKRSIVYETPTNSAIYEEEI